MINLKVSNLSLHYNQPLLDRVDLFHSGSGVIALIGDNGTGKSSLLKILAGMEEPLSGSVTWSNGTTVGYMRQELEESTLSGGQKKIMILSELIYASNFDALLLDEPDNHLDLEGKEWLESAIAGYGGLVIVISHDREFLEKVSTKVWLLEDRTIRSFPYGFGKFQETYNEELLASRRLYQTQLAEKKRLEDLVQTFKVKSTFNSGASSTYRNMIKRLEHHVANMIEDPDRNAKKITLASKKAGKIIKGKMAIVIKDLTFRYDKNTIFQDANFDMTIHDKIALISPNGSGKSTLIKLLIGKLEPQNGVAKVGVGINYGYYSQDHQEILPPEGTAIDCFVDRYPIYKQEAEKILSKFLFSKQTMKSKIRMLSGGQKARLQLALFLYSNPDMLILDEPTNHLDIKSIEVLEDFLKEYHGAVLIISHDRQLIRNLDLLTFEVKDKKIVEVKG